MPGAALPAGMQATITPSRVSGRARAPPSKSYTHRALLAAGYADGALVRHPLVPEISEDALVHRLPELELHSG